MRVVAIALFAAATAATYCYDTATNCTDPTKPDCCTNEDGTKCFNNATDICCVYGHGLAVCKGSESCVFGGYHTGTKAACCPAGTAGCEGFLFDGICCGAGSTCCAADPYSSQISTCCPKGSTCCKSKTAPYPGHPSQNVCCAAGTKCDGGDPPQCV